MKLKCRLGLHNYEFQKATKIMRHTVLKYQCLSCNKIELRSKTLDMKPVNEFGGDILKAIKEMNNE